MHQRTYFLITSSDLAELSLAQFDYIHCAGSGAGEVTSPAGTVVELAHGPSASDPTGGGGQAVEAARGVKDPPPAPRALRSPSWRPYVDSRYFLQLPGMYSIECNL